MMNRAVAVIYRKVCRAAISGITIASLTRSARLAVTTNRGQRVPATKTSSLILRGKGGEKN